MGSERAKVVDQVAVTSSHDAVLRETDQAGPRRQLLSFLQDEQPAWNEQAHPELAAGSGAWVKSIRGESEAHTSKAD